MAALIHHLNHCESGPLVSLTHVNTRFLYISATNDCYPILVTTFFRCSPNTLLQAQDPIMNPQSALPLILSTGAQHLGGQSTFLAGTPMSTFLYYEPTNGKSDCRIQNYIPIPSFEVPYLIDLFLSSHTSELPEVFMLPFAPNDTTNAGCVYSSVDKLAASFMSGSWTAMASTGKPAPAISRKLKDPALRAIKAWPRFNISRPTTMALNFSHVGPAPWDISERCKIWDEILDYQVEAGTWYAP